MDSTPVTKRWLVVAGAILTLSATTTFAQISGGPPLDPFLGQAAPFLSSSAPPQEKALKGPDGRILKREQRTGVANTRPELANRPLPPATGPRTAPKALGSVGVVPGQNLPMPFGSKGEKVAIAFRTGDFMPPIGEKLQPALRQLAQRRAAQTNASSAPAASVYGLILLNGRLDAALKAQLEALGVELFGFYPHAAYQARIPAFTLQEVAALPQVRWIGQPSADQKLAPELRPFLAPGAAVAGQTRWLYVSLFGPDVTGQAQAAMQAAGARISLYDPGLFVLSMEASAATIRRLLAMDSVLYVEPILPGGIAHNQSMASLNLDRMWGVYDPLPPGSTGQLKIGICDTGVYPYHTDFSGMIGGWWGWHIISGENAWDDLHGHGTHVTGTILGQGLANPRYRGGARGLPNRGDPGNHPDYLNAQVWNRTGYAVGDSQYQGLRAMNGEFGGAGFRRQVFNMSGGSGGTGLVGTDAESRKTDELFGNNVLPVIAAGNEGPSFGRVRLPGVAKGALTVGAIYDDDFLTLRTDGLADYSSRGPTGDGRHKPDVVAPGSWISSILNRTASGYTYDWEGTSMATPHVTGLAAGLRGHFDVPAWVLKSVILANAIDLGYGRDEQGFGKVDALRTHAGWDGNWSGWWSSNGGTGDLRYVDLVLDHDVSLLRVVLTYPDPPAAAGASFAIQNDLDLIVQRGGLTTDTAGQWRSTSGLDTVEAVTIVNARAGTYRLKVYTYAQRNGDSQRWGVVAAWVDGPINPNVSIRLSVPRAVKPNVSFYAKADATAGSYIASGVFGRMELLSGGTALEGLWYKRSGNPASSDEWFWYANPWPGTEDWYNPFGMNQGNIAAGQTRTLWWQVKGTTEGVKNLRYSVRSSNGGSASVTEPVIVDGTAPTFGATESIHWGPDLRPDVTCKTQDSLAGLDVGSAYYRYTTDGGSTWSLWISAACTGGHGTTAQQTITAYDVPFGQNDFTLNRIQFAIADTAGNWGYSPITGHRTPVPTALVFTPNPVAGGLATTGKVTLNLAAPTDGAQVVLLNLNPAAAVPSTVTVPAGATSATFSVPTTPVNKTASGVVYATYGGTTVNKTLKVRPIGVKSLTLNPNPVVGGNNVTGTVVLDLPVPASIGNVVVSLKSSNTAIANPTVASLTFTTGQDTKSFTIRTSRVSVASFANITAKGPGSSKTVKLKVTP